MNNATLNALRTAAILVGFTALGTALLAYTFVATRDNIARNEAQAKRDLIAQTLPASLYDNDVVRDVAQLPPTQELGTRHPSTAYRARLQGMPSALVLEVTAPDGYSGDIDLLVAIQANGEVAGVRIVSHKETPGLGDSIDSAKSDWIRQFDHAALGQHPDAWKVKKDGGRFDYMSGATISPRAVVKAVHRALAYYAKNGAAIFAQTNPDLEEPR